MTRMGASMCSCSWETLAAAVHVVGRDEGMYALPSPKRGDSSLRARRSGHQTLGLEQRDKFEHQGRPKEAAVSRVSSVNPDLRTRHGRAVRWGRLCGKGHQHS